MKRKDIFSELKYLFMILNEEFNPKDYFMLSTIKLKYLMIQKQDQVDDEENIEYKIFKGV